MIYHLKYRRRSAGVINSSWSVLHLCFKVIYATN